MDEVRAVTCLCVFAVRVMFENIKKEKSECKSPKWNKVLTKHEDEVYEARSVIG